MRRFESGVTTVHGKDDLIREEARALEESVVDRYTEYSGLQHQYSGLQQEALVRSLRRPPSF